MPRRRLLLSLCFVLAALVAVEGYRVARFYADVSASRTALLALKSDLDLTNLTQSRDSLEAKHASLEDASARLDRAGAFARQDPLLLIALHVPVAGKQARGLQQLVLAAQEASHTGVNASDVALAFAGYERNPWDPLESTCRHASLSIL